MARGTKPVETDESDDIEVVEPAFSPEDDENSKIDQIRAAFDADPNDVQWRCNLYRVRKGEKDAFLFTCGVEELPVNERLRDEYGTGHYRSRIYRNNRLATSIDYFVEASAKPQIAAPVQTELTALSEAMSKQNDLLLQFMQMTMLKNNQTATIPNADPLDQMSKMIGVIGTMIGLRPEQKDPTDLILKGIELAGQINGNSNAGEKNLYDIVETALKSPILERAINAQTQGQPQIGQTPTQAQPSQDPQAQALAQHPLAPFLGQLNTLMEAAQRNSDPNLYADYLLDALPDPIIHAIVFNETVMPELYSKVPNMNTYKPWFEAVRVSMRQAVEASVDQPAENAHVEPEQQPERTPNAGPPANTNSKPA